MKKVFIFFFMISFIFLSCDKTADKFPGFSHSESGYYYKLQVLGDGKKKPLKGEFLLLDLAFKTENDSIFLTTKYQNLLGNVFYDMNEQFIKGSFEEELFNMVEGDSVSYFVNAQILFSSYFKKDTPLFLNKKSFVKVEAKLQKILTSNEHTALLKKIKEEEDIRLVEEYNRIQKFVEENKVMAQMQEDGLVYIPTKEGYGLMPDTGMTVQLKMLGTFMNGQVFDNTFQSKIFEFMLGEEYQVIWGLQEGIKLMHEGGKAKLIIPSYLAFGEKGSSTGIVPPYTTVIYDVELLKVN